MITKIKTKFSTKEILLNIYLLLCSVVFIAGFITNKISQYKVISQVHAEVPIKNEINVSYGAFKQETHLTKNKDIYLKKGTEDQNYIISYLWDKTHNIDMILTFYAESKLDPDAVGKNNKDFLVAVIPETQDTEISYVYKNVTVSTDHGICQLNSRYHKDFINSEEFKTIDKQLDYCISVYKDGIKKGRITTTFYGYNRRMNYRSAFYISQNAYDIYWGRK